MMIDSEGVLRAMPVFEALSDAEIRELARHAQHREYRKNQVLFWDGDSVDRLFVVIDGWIKLYAVGDDGEAFIARMVSRGDIVGLTAICGKYECHSFNAEVAETAHLLEMPASALRQVTIANPSFQRVLLELMQKKVQQQLEYRQVMLMSAPRRVGWLLLQLSAKMKGNGGSFAFPYDRSVAAAELGMSPETFSRSLSALEPATVSCRNSEIHIGDFHALFRYYRTGMTDADATRVRRSGKCMRNDHDAGGMQGTQA